MDGIPFKGELFRPFLYYLPEKYGTKTLCDYQH
jgi:hypothetical protein